MRRFRRKTTEKLSEFGGTLLALVVLDDAVLRQRSQRVATRSEGGSNNAARPRQAPQLVALGRVPMPQRAVEAQRDQRLAAGRKRPVRD